MLEPRLDGECEIQFPAFGTIEAEADPLQQARFVLRQAFRLAHGRLGREILGHARGWRTAGRVDFRGLAKSGRPRKTRTLGRNQNYTGTTRSRNSTRRTGPTVTRQSGMLLSVRITLVIPDQRGFRSSLSFVFNGDPHFGGPPFSRCRALSLANLATERSS
jgi:hypothetical protein